VSPVRDLDMFASSYEAHVLAEAVLQLTEPDLFHGDNVASWRYIVNAGAAKPMTR